MRVTPPVSEDDAHFHVLSRIEAGIPMSRKVDISFRSRILNDKFPTFDFSNCLFSNSLEINLEYCDKCLCPSLN